MMICRVSLKALAPDSSVAAGYKAPLAGAKEQEGDRAWGCELATLLLTGSGTSHELPPSLRVQGLSGLCKARTSCLRCGIVG